VDSTLETMVEPELARLLALRVRPLSTLDVVMLLKGDGERVIERERVLVVRAVPSWANPRVKASLAGRVMTGGI
jgi:hypothetical protein